MEIIQIIVIALTVAIISGLIKQYKPEYAIFVQIAGSLIILGLAFGILSGLFSDIGSLLNQIDNGPEYAKLLFKALGISLLTQFASDICVDAGEKALSSKVELAGKVVLLAMAMPLFNVIASFVASIINSV